MNAPHAITDYSAALAGFAATLRYEDVPPAVVRRAEDGNGSNPETGRRYAGTIPLLAEMAAGVIEAGG